MNKEEILKKITTFDANEKYDKYIDPFELSSYLSGLEKRIEELENKPTLTKEQAEKLYIPTPSIDKEEQYMKDDEGNISVDYGICDCPEKCQLHKEPIKDLEEKLKGEMWYAMLSSIDKTSQGYAKQFIKSEIEKALNEVVPLRDVAYKPAGNADNLDGWNACIEQIKSNISNYIK